MGIAYKWAAKSLIQKAISFAPDPDKLNHKIQDRLGRSEANEAEFLTRARMVRYHLNSFEAAGLGSNATGVNPGVTVLELGTGWLPAVPIFLWLCGADRIISVDHVDHSSDQKVVETAGLIASMLQGGMVETELNATRDDRVQAFLDLVATGPTASQIKELIGLTSEIADITEFSTDTPIHAVVSNLVYEHIPAPLLGPITKACYDLVEPGGVTSHVADLCDHGHYVDPENITSFNYLRFSSKAWKLISNDIQHENRLRLPEYLQMYSDAGVPIDAKHTQTGDWDQLAPIPVAEEFRHFTPDELMVTMLHATSLVPAAPNQAGE